MARAMATFCFSPADSSAGKASCLVLQTHLLEREQDAGHDVLVGESAGDAHRQRDVLEHRAVVEQAEVLVDDAEGPPQQRSMRARRRPPRERADRDGAVAWAGSRG